MCPESTVYGYYDGTSERVHNALHVKCREAEEREISPTAMS